MIGKMPLSHRLFCDAGLLSCLTKATMVATCSQYRLLSFFPQDNYDKWLRGEIARFERRRIPV